MFFVVAPWDVSCPACCRALGGLPSGVAVVVVWRGGAGVGVVVGIRIVDASIFAVVIVFAIRFL